MLMVTLGTGVGGGIIIDGKLYTGCNSLAGELGHIVIRQGGEPCGCGRFGCLQAYSSAAALVKFAHRALDAGRESSLRENGSNLNAKHICDAVDAGDALACGLFETYCDNLACGLASLINIFQPECIVLGGGLAGYGESCSRRCAGASRRRPSAATRIPSWSWPRSAMMPVWSAPRCSE